jgi:gamma-glutamylcyclotransferase (GGCT)/AIG2-like uncharacterized protein YtfP
MTEVPEATDGLLFVYGTLGPGQSHEGGPHAWQRDAVRGRIYDLGPYPALVHLDDPGAPWAEGYVRAVTARELIDVLDPYEGGEDAAYTRKTVRSREGRTVWVYEYLAPLPAFARGPLTSWLPIESVTPR